MFKKWGPLIILTMATFIIVIDTTIMNVSIPALVEDLNTTVSGVQAAISIYALVMASTILLGAKLADIIGKKRTFYIGLIIFGTGTSIAALSHSLAVLIFGWSILEGIGSALMIPNTQTILRSTYDGKDRVFGYAVIGSMFAIAAAVGPLVGGYLTTFYTWRLAFAFEVLVVLIALFANFLIKKDKVGRERPTLDIIGVIISAIGFAGVVLGILAAQTYGFLFAKQPLMIGDFAIEPFGLSVAPFILGLGVLMLIIFLNWEEHVEKNGRNPLLKTSVLKYTGFIPGILGQFFQLVLAAGFLFIYPLYLQLSFGMTAMDTGFALIPYSLAVLIFSLLGAKLSSKVAPKKLVQIGFLLSTLGFFMMANNIDIGAGAREIIPGSFVLGLGVGLIASQVINLILSTVDVKDTAEASGVNGVSGQLGNSIGVALVGGILMTTLLSGVISGIDESKTLTSSEKQQITTSIETDIEIVSDKSLESTLEDLNVTNEKADDIVEINSVARTDAFRISVLFLSFVSLLGLVASPRLPNTKLL